MKKEFYKILISLAIVSAVLLPALRVTALGDSAFSLDIVPAYPDPGSSVSAKVSSYSFDVDSGNITWKIDGKTVGGGAGVKSVDFISPESGKSRQVSVYITTADGSRFSRTSELRGNNVDLLWEALTYIPSWYKGKALPTIGSSIKVSAISNIYSGGRLLANNELVYEWLVNYKKDFAGSGAGKNTFSFTIKNSEDYVITAKISDKDGNELFGKAIKISSSNTGPKIIFYEDSPLEGERVGSALKNNFILSGAEMVLRAEPFFFSRNDLGDLAYSWMINRKAVAPEIFQNILSLRIPEEGKGSSLIDLKINNPNEIMQYKSGALKIGF